MRELLALLIPACAISVFLYRSAGWTSARAAIASLALALCLGIGFSSVVSTGLIVIGIAPTSRAFVLADVALWVIVGTLGLFTRRAAESREPRAQSRETWLLPADVDVGCGCCVCDDERPGRDVFCRDQSRVSARRVGCVGDLEPARAISVSRWRG